MHPEVANLLRIIHIMMTACAAANRATVANWYLLSIDTVHSLFLKN